MTNLHALIIGSASYNIFMCFSGGDNDRYMYSAGLMVVLLIVDFIMGYFGRNDED